MIIWLVAAPLLFSIILLLYPLLAERRGFPFLLAVSLIPLVLLIYGHNEWIGSTLKLDWIPAFSVAFYLKVDTLSLIFLYLTATIIPVSLLALPRTLLPQPHIFYALVFLLQALLMGFFMARDLVLFILLWEAMLLPLYFIIASWGGADRQAAAIKFFVYMVAGSILIVAGALALYVHAEGAGRSATFDMDVLQAYAGGLPYAVWIFAAFLLAFAVKTPLFPFHAWLPDAYCQAPAAGTILLAAILSKAGVYGILRIGWELFPLQLQHWSPFLLGCAIAGTLYGGLAAWRQEDFKRLVAYSSFSHINLVLAGLFILSPAALTGGILQAINHAITIAALFLAAWWLEERLGSCSIRRGSGLAHSFPILCWLTLSFILSSIALPGMNNFVGEFLILFGLFTQHPWLALLLGSTTILSVLYMLRWMQESYFGTPSAADSSWKDITIKELTEAVLLLVILFFIGIYPAPLLNMITPVAEKISANDQLQSTSLHTGDTTP